MQELNPPAIISESHAELEQLAYEATSALDASRKAMMTVVERYRDAGKALCAAKEKCEHGQWMKWLEKHKITPQTAQRAMTIFTNYGKLLTVSNLKDALSIIATDKTAEKSDTSDDSVITCRDCRLIGTKDSCDKCKQKVMKKAEREAKKAAELTGDKAVDGLNRVFKTLEKKSIALAHSRCESPAREALFKAGRAHRVALDAVIALGPFNAQEPFKKVCKHCGGDLLLAMNEKGRWKALSYERVAWGGYEVMNNIITEIEKTEEPAYVYHGRVCTKEKPKQGELNGTAF